MSETSRIAIEAVEIGSVWRESDKRFERYVKVIGTDVKQGEACFLIVRCSASGRSGGGKTTVAKARRFGKAYRRTQSGGE